MLYMKKNNSNNVYTFFKGDKPVLQASANNKEMKRINIVESLDSDEISDCLNMIIKEQHEITIPEELWSQIKPYKMYGEYVDYKSKFFNIEGTSNYMLIQAYL